MRACVRTYSGHTKERNPEIHESEESRSNAYAWFPSPDYGRGKQRRNTEESRNAGANASTRRRNFTVVDMPQLSRIPPSTFNHDCTVRLFLRTFHRCGSKARSPQINRSTYVTTATRRVTVSFFRPAATRDYTRREIEDVSRENCYRYPSVYTSLVILIV